MRNAGHLPLGLAHRGDNLVRSFLVLYFDVFALVLDELGFEKRRLAGIQHRVNGPVFLRNKRANLLLALDNQPQSHRLDAPGGEPAPNFVPQNGRNFIAHDAIEHAASLLRIHQVGVHLPRVIEGCADGLGRNFVEGDPKNLLGVDGHNFFLSAVLFFLLNRLFRRGHFLLKPGNAGFLFDELGRLGEHHGKMRRNGFPFAIGVARQIHGFGGVRRFPQIVDDFAFARNDLQRRLKDFVVVNADQFHSRLLLALCFLDCVLGFALSLFFAALFFAGQTNANGLLGQVHHVADGGLDGKIPSQIFVNCFRLCGRFDNNQRTSHVAFVTP